MISVVIPTFNASADLPRALAPLVEGVQHGLVKQAIVADGGSTDETLEIAEATGCDVVVSAKGRAKQMIAGAVAAKGSWLLFLRPETMLAPGWLEETERFLRRSDASQRAAVFRFAFDDDVWEARNVTFWARLRSSVFKLPSGEQGLLISSALYDALGGFSDLALMEDIDLVRRIGARRLVILQSEAIISGEKYRHDGYSRRAWRDLFLLMRFLMGAHPDALANDLSHRAPAKREAR